MKFKILILFFTLAFVNGTYAQDKIDIQRIKYILKQNIKFVDSIQQRVKRQEEITKYISNLNINSIYFNDSLKDFFERHHCVSKKNIIELYRINEKISYLVFLLNNYNDVIINNTTAKDINCELFKCDTLILDTLQLKSLKLDTIIYAHKKAYKRNVDLINSQYKVFNKNIELSISKLKEQTRLVNGFYQNLYTLSKYNVESNINTQKEIQQQELRYSILKEIEELKIMIYSHKYYRKKMFWK